MVGFCYLLWYEKVIIHIDVDGFINVRIVFG